MNQPSARGVNWLAVWLALGGLAFAQVTNNPETVRGDDNGRFRVSALIKTDAGVKVGLVDRERDRSYYLREGERDGELEVVSADYDREEVVIRHAGSLIRFQLAGDPTTRELFLMNPPPPAAGALTTPDPEDRDLYPPHEPVTGDPPPPTSLGPGIESFLKDHPELAKEMQKPQGRYGSGIESMIRLYPELKKQLDQPPEESEFGPVLEELMKQHPEFRGDTNAVSP